MKVGLVDKPCFDKDLFKDGTAIEIKSAVATFNALVIRCEPLKLVIASLDEDSHINKGVIEVNTIASGAAELRVLK
ncbi:MAG: hypothetical protein ABFC57_06335 [Veillonellales bacterium]